MSGVGGTRRREPGSDMAVQRARDDCWQKGMEGASGSTHEYWRSR